MIRPLKVGLPEYKEIEERVENVIFAKYLPGVEIDRGMIRIADEWVLTMEFVVIRGFDDGWQPDRARHEFMTAYERLRRAIQ